MAAGTRSRLVNDDLARARRIQGRDHDSVVKLRPALPSVPNGLAIFFSAELRAARV